jgi:hypothetical protein
MKYKFVNKPEKCPECGSDKIAYIMYGLPNYSPSLQQEIRENKIVLGGCCITDDDPAWKCVDCKTYIYRIEIDFKKSAN